MLYIIKQRKGKKYNYKLKKFKNKETLKLEGDTLVVYNI